jgi:pimeloyl-ACP methyl ester carboxylesterase
VDAREFVADIKIPMLILTPTKSRMAPLDGKDSQREQQAKVKGSTLVAIDGAGHEIHVDGAAKCQKVCLKFLKALKAYF